MQSHFERSSFVVVALEPRDGGDLLSASMLAKLKTLSTQLSQIDGVSGVISPATLPDISTDGDTLDFRPVPLSKAVVSLDNTGDFGEVHVLGYPVVSY